ncbi:MAG: hypothetical protein ACSLE2_04350 [Lysobacterales bacterium]
MKQHDRLSARLSGLSDLGKLLVVFAVLFLSACDSGTQRAAPAETLQLPSEQPAPKAAPQAGDSDGVISAKLEGTERTWYITSAEYDGQLMSQSDWSPLYASVTGVSLFGHTTPTTALSSAEALLVAFSLVEEDGQWTASEPEITWLSGGLMNNHSSSYDGSAAVTIEAAEFDGDHLTISGTFSGSLPFKSHKPGGETDSAPTIAIEDGRFEGVVRRLND